MAAYIDDDNDDLWELAASYVGIFPPRRLRLFRNRANTLSDLDEVEFRARFRVKKQCFAYLLTARLRNCKTMVVNSLVSMTTTSCVIILTSQMLVYKNS